MPLRGHPDASGAGVGRDGRIIRTRKIEEDRGAGEGAEDHVERHAAIAQRAEAPVGQPAATDADEVHDAVAGRPQLRPHDLATGSACCCSRRSPSRARTGRGTPRRRRAYPALPTPKIAGAIRPMPMALDVDAPAPVPPHPAIRQPAAGDRADDRRACQYSVAATPACPWPIVEPLLEDRRHPVAYHPAGQGRAA